MAGSSNAELADLLNEMLSVQERLKKHGIAFGAGLPGPPAGQPEASASSSYAPAVTPALGTTTHPSFWGGAGFCFPWPDGVFGQHVAASL